MEEIPFESTNKLNNFSVTLYPNYPNDLSINKYMGDLSAKNQSDAFQLAMNKYFSGWKLEHSSETMGQMIISNPQNNKKAMVIVGQPENTN